MKKIFLFIGIILLLGSVPLGVFLVKERQEIRMRAAPATTLSIFPSSTTKDINEIFNIIVKIDTGSNLVMGADLEILFNKDILEAIDIVPGSFLGPPSSITTAGKNINNNNGRIFAGLLINTVNLNDAKQGTGDLAVVSFKAKQAGRSDLTFGSATKVLDLSEGNVLNNKNDGSILVNAAPTATPTPLPTNTPTPTTTSILTPTPTSISTSTPTTTPTAGNVGMGTTNSTLTPTSTHTPTIRQTFTPTTQNTTSSATYSLPQTATFFPTVFLLGGGILFFIAFFLKIW